MSDLSYSELRRREVINGSDGKRLGHIVDLVFCAESGKINGMILPYGRRGILQRSQDLFVPWSCVQKIGEDVILVEIASLPGSAPMCAPKKEPDKLPRKPARGDCDGRCEKCMLFECASRWETQ